MAAISIGAAVIGGGLSYLSSRQQSKAIENAANQQAAATNQASEATLQAQSDALAAQAAAQAEARRLQKPWIDTGSQANTRLATLMGIAPTKRQVTVYKDTGERVPAGGVQQAPTQQAIMPPAGINPADFAPRYRPVGSGAGYDQAVPLSAIGLPPLTNGQIFTDDASRVNLFGYEPVQMTPQEMMTRLTQLYSQQPQATPTPARETEKKWVKTAAGKSEDYGDLAKPFSLEDFHTDPGYGFLQSEGEQAIKRAGVLNSGRTLKALMRFNTGLADQSYNTAYGRYNTDQGNLFNRLFAISNQGQNTSVGAGNQVIAGANATGNIVTGTANTLGNLYTNQANAAGAAGIAGANSRNSGYAALADAAGNIGSSLYDYFNRTPTGTASGAYGPMATGYAWGPAAATATNYNPAISSNLSWLNG